MKAFKIVFFFYLLCCFCWKTNIHIYIHCATFCRFCFCLLLLCGIMPMHFIILMASLQAMIVKHSPTRIHIVIISLLVAHHFYFNRKMYFYHRMVWVFFTNNKSVCLQSMGNGFCIGIINFSLWNFKRLANRHYGLGFQCSCVNTVNELKQKASQCMLLFCISNCILNWNVAV